jgi:hypothetical protein
MYGCAIVHEDQDAPISEEISVYLDEALACVPALAIPEAFDRFQAHIDPAWIEEASLATGTAAYAGRKLTHLAEGKLTHPWRSLVRGRAYDLRAGLGKLRGDDSGGFSSGVRFRIL